MLDMFLDVTPTPKARPRLGRGNVVYTPKSTSDAERDIQVLLKAECNRKKIQITDNGVCVKMRFNYLYPKNLSAGDRLLKDLDMLYRTKRPDVDNLAKLVLDAMNGLIYFDDAQVCKLVCEKIYSNREGIELKVIEI